MHVLLLDVDAETRAADRCDMLGRCDEIQAALRIAPILRGPDLYMWRPEDFYFHLPSQPRRDMGPSSSAKTPLR